MNNFRLSRTFYCVLAVGLIAVCSRSATADVVIGDFENGSVEGWTSQGETISSVMGKGNTLGASSVGIQPFGNFWGLISPNLNSHRDDFLKASFLSLDLTFIRDDLTDPSSYAQMQAFALHDSSGSFVQRNIGAGAAGANDSDSKQPLAFAGQWRGVDGTRTLKIDLNSFAAPSAATMGETSYKQYLTNHPEITSFDIWISCQAGPLLATYYVDNIKLVIPGGTGDFDQNGKTELADVATMVTALTDLNAYKAAHNNLTDAQLLAIGDVDADGKVTNADLQKLLGVLASGTGTGSLTAVPEPMSVVLAVIGLAIIVPARGIRRRI